MTLHVSSQQIKKLFHPLRLAILSELTWRESARASDIAKALNEAPNKISYHLKILSEAGLIEPVNPAENSDGRETWWRYPHEGLAFGGSVTVSDISQFINVNNARRAQVLGNPSSPLNSSAPPPYALINNSLGLTKKQAEFAAAILNEAYEKIQAMAEGSQDDNADYVYYLDLVLAPIRGLDR